MFSLKVIYDFRENYYCIVLNYTLSLSQRGGTHISERERERERERGSIIWDYAITLLILDCDLYCTHSLVYGELKKIKLKKTLKSVTTGCMCCF